MRERNPVARRPAPVVWVVGSINADVVVTTARLPRPGETVAGHGVAHGLGGKGANQAVAAARVGAVTEMVGALGDDATSDALLEGLAHDGVGAAAVERTTGAPGTAIVLVDDTGENAIVVVPGANGTVTPEIAAAPAYAPGDVVVVQGEIPLAATVAALTAARRAGATTVWNPAPADVAMTPHLGLAAVIVVNEIELEALAGPGQVADAVARLAATADAEVVATLGPAGIVARIAGREVIRAARDVAVVDTTGAGDCFVGVLAARLASGDPLDVAVAVANVAASIAVGRPGAAASMPTAAELTAAITVDPKGNR